MVLRILGSLYLRALGSPSFGRVVRVGILMTSRDAPIEGVAHNGGQGVMLSAR